MQKGDRVQLTPFGSHQHEYKSWLCVHRVSEPTYVDLSVFGFALAAFGDLLLL